ncbi:hypothetical protein NQD34_014898 [Periophthalmus magnuspinnatus]|nr:hypothetical protein NQD34_014898 [Periophthalmus magnuspinnatus]
MCVEITCFCYAAKYMARTLNTVILAPLMWDVAMERMNNAMKSTLSMLKGAISFHDHVFLYIYQKYYLKGAKTFLVTPLSPLHGDVPVIALPSCITVLPSAFFLFGDAVTTAVVPESSALKATNTTSGSERPSKEHKVRQGS